MDADVRNTGDGIIIGLASAPFIAQLLRKNGISTAPIAGKWETYGRAVVPAPWDARKRALVIFGSDTRGTIWGVIDLTREMGVSTRLDHGAHTRRGHDHGHLQRG